MGSAKEIVLRPITHQEADVIVRRFHYSGKVKPNSQFHIGVYYQGRLEGAMQFGPSVDKRRMQGLIKDTPWNGFIELNRMAFSDALPRNSESRALGIAMRILRSHAPHVQWVVSFADGAQCGDGTIYRASGFVLTSIKKNNSIWKASNVGIVSRTTVTKGNDAARGGGGASMKQYKDAGFTPIPGFQLRYIFFLDPTARDRLTVPILPFSEIKRRGAGMYKGQSCATSIEGNAPAIHAGEGGAVPTVALQLTEDANTPEQLNQ